jgi:hypothetical protein
LVADGTGPGSCMSPALGGFMGLSALVGGGPRRGLGNPEVADSLWVQRLDVPRRGGIHCLDIIARGPDRGQGASEHILPAAVG